MESYSLEQLLTGGKFLDDRWVSASDHYALMAHAKQQEERLTVLSNQNSDLSGQNHLLAQKLNEQMASPKEGHFNRGICDCGIQRKLIVCEHCGKRVK